MTSPQWADVRKHMLIAPNVAYLNTGSFGCIPSCVFERVSSLRRCLAENPTEFMLRSIPALLWEARVQLAQFVGGETHRLLFTTNVSSAINQIASSISFSVPGEILLTDCEYDTMRACWDRAAKRCGLTIRTFSVPMLATETSTIVEAAAAAMNQYTRLLFFSHILSATGLVMPAKDLCAEARRRGIVTVVDGAHAPGFIELKLSELGCDFYAGSGHKWLLAPTGTGFLYIGPGNEELLEPMQVSWGYRTLSSIGDLDLRDEYGSTPRLRRLECEGTRDICPWLTIPAAIEFQAEIGKDNIEARQRYLVNLVRKRLSNLDRLVAVTPTDPTLCGPIIAFRISKELDVCKFRRRLSEYFCVETAVIVRSDQILLRISTQFHNNECDIEQLASALEQLI